MDELKNIGQTKDAGWQFGIRKSVPLSPNEVWEFLFSENGTELWLQDAKREFSTYQHLSHIRTKWKLKHWDNEANLQMRILSNKDNTTIAFHIDKLLSESQREETKTYWSKIIKAIAEKITTNR